MESVFCLRFVFIFFYTGSFQAPPGKNHPHLKCQFTFTCKDKIHTVQDIHLLLKPIISFYVDLFSILTSQLKPNNHSILFLANTVREVRLGLGSCIIHVQPLVLGRWSSHSQLINMKMPIESIADKYKSH